MSGVIGSGKSKSGVILPKGGYCFYVINTNFTQTSDGYWTANVEITNIGNCFDLSNDKFIAPVDGAYQLHWHSLYRGNGSVRTSWYIDGTKHAQTGNSDYSDAYVNTADQITIAINGVFDLNAGQEVQIYSDISGGNLYASANGHNGFSGHLLV
tara:strand:- start:59 stop:520 length:462 start_codon:yes stop_codon:yes gene_type:complete